MDTLTLQDLDKLTKEIQDKSSSKEFTEQEVEQEFIDIQEKIKKDITKNEVGFFRSIFWI